jgi:hypothetical protein
MQFLPLSLSSQENTDCEFNMTAIVATSVGPCHSHYNVLELNETPEVDAEVAHIPR